MSSSAEIQIGIVADTHFWFEADCGFGAGQRQLQPYSQLLLDLLLADLQAQPLDLVLHLGDLTCGGGGYDMPAHLVPTSIQKIRTGLETVGCPVGMVPGNHDCRLGHSFAETDVLLGLTSDLGTSYTFPEARLHVELIHSQAHTRAERAESLQEDIAPIHGRTAPRELARLQRSLQAAAGLNVLVGSHQLLVPMSPWREPVSPPMQVANSPEIVRLLARHGRVRAIFQGHTHTYDLHQVPLGCGTCTAVVVPALIQWPVSWLHLTATPEELTWQLRPLPVPPEFLTRSKAQVESDQPPGRPAWSPWRIDLSA